jgi:hypothetical protein
MLKFRVKRTKSESIRDSSRRFLLAIKPPKIRLAPGRLRMR